MGFEKWLAAPKLEAPGDCDELIARLRFATGAQPHSRLCFEQSAQRLWDKLTPQI
jgi:hypothetical protein